MDVKEETEQWLLMDSNKKYIDLLRCGLSWRNISNKQVSINTKISESTVSKVLSGKVISKKLYYRTITILMERYKPIELFREIIDRFDVVDDEIQIKLDLLEERQNRIIKLNKKYNILSDPYCGN